MEFWKINVKLFNGDCLEFISERNNVREFLEYYLRKVCCGVVFVKDCYCVEDVNGDGWLERFLCYRDRDNKLRWEDMCSFEGYCDLKRSIREERSKDRVISIDFG